jgi:hypothetical protein
VVLADLLSADRLARLRDNELKTNPEQALTLPELFSTLQQQIWSEVVMARWNRSTVCADRCNASI